MAAKKRLLLAFIGIIIVLGLLIPSLVALFAKDKPTFPKETALDGGEDEAYGVEDAAVKDAAVKDVTVEDVTLKDVAVKDVIAKDAAIKEAAAEYEETVPLYSDEYYTEIATGVASIGEEYLINRGFIAYENGYFDNFAKSFIVPGGNGISVYYSPGGELIFSLYIQP